jgi:hypothetical protein
VIDELRYLKVSIVKSYFPEAPKKSTMADPHLKFELGALLWRVEHCSLPRHCESDIFIHTVYLDKFNSVKVNRKTLYPYHGSNLKNVVNDFQKIQKI